MWHTTINPNCYKHISTAAVDGIVTRSIYIFTYNIIFTSTQHTWNSRLFEMLRTIFYRFFFFKLVFLLNIFQTLGFSWHWTTMVHIIHENNFFPVKNKASEILNLFNLLKRHTASWQSEKVSKPGIEPESLSLRANFLSLTNTGTKVLGGEFRFL